MRMKSLLLSITAGAAVVAIALTTAAGPRPAAAPLPALNPGGEFGSPAIADGIYYPITPCRVVDTRHGAGANGTPFGNGTTRTLWVAGTFGFAPQGGVSGGCGIPAAASAASTVITAVGPRAAGFLRAWPAGSTEPGATLLSYGTFSMGTGATVKLPVGAVPSLTVKNYGGPTDVVIDVTGYFARPLEANIRHSTATSVYVANRTSRVLSVTNPSTGTYVVTFDTDISFCAAQTQPTLGNLYSSGYTSGNSVVVRTWELRSNTVDVIPADFDVTVTC